MKMNLHNIMKVNKLKYGKDYKYNLLFLDFDGVINVPVLDFDHLTDEELSNLYNKANIDRINNLNKLCKMFDLNIVISSSWRVSGLEYCKNYLLQSELDPTINIVGLTKNEGFMKRYIEIYDYLIEHSNFTNFLIIDDLYMHHLDYHAIKTEFEFGFNENKLNEAIELCKKF